MPLLQEVLEIATEQWVSDDTLRRALDRLNYVWKRPRYDLDPDPEREKKRRIRRQIRALPRRSVVLAQDETDLLLFPPLRRLVEARRRRQGLAERPQCPACDLRGDELADGDTAVCAARMKDDGGRAWRTAYWLEQGKSEMENG